MTIDFDQLYIIKWNNGCPFYYTVIGPGVYIRCENEDRARELAAALNSVYYFGKTQGLNLKETSDES